MEPTEEPLSIPSWLKWPPNCCQTCVSWEQDKYDQWIGKCANSVSLDSGERTDARYRCPCFQRKSDA
jgi:hypothetical protein